MFKNLKAIHSYYKFAHLKILPCIFLVFLILVPTVLSIFSPIFAARVISSLTIYDFKQAKLNLLYVFLCDLLETIFFILYKFISRKISKVFYIRLTKLAFNINETINNSTVEFLTEKINTLVSFNESFIYKLCHGVKSATLLIILSIENVLFLILLIPITIILFLILSYFSEKTKKLKSNLINEEGLFSNFLNTLKSNHNHIITSKEQEKYAKNIENLLKINKKISIFTILTSKLSFLIMSGIAFGFGIYLVNLVSNTFLSLASYLIYYPYVTAVTKSLLEFLTLFSNVPDMRNNLIEFQNLEFDKLSKVSLKKES
ncbi:MAG: ABC transporter ATP-binding protein [Clostridia bacterium]|nr:ABC transporter ATP-binding protein [Clostridia bacterium]